MDGDDADDVDTDWLADQSAELLADEVSSRDCVAKELATQGRPGLLALVAAAGDPRAEVRESVAFGLGRVEDLGGEGLEALLGLCEDEDTNVRARACVALDSVGPDADRRTVLRVAAVLRDAGAAGRLPAAYGAVHALARFGPAAGAAAPALIEFLDRARREPGRWHTPRAVEALGLVRPCDGAAVEALRAELATHPGEAAGALALCGSLARGAMAEVRPFLDDDRPMVRLAAAEALGRVESDPRAIDVLVDGAVRGDMLIRTEALAGLGHIRRPPGPFDRLRRRVGDAATGFAALAESLMPGFERDRMLIGQRIAMSRVIRGYGPIAAASFAPGFRSWLADEDPWMRIAGAEALARVEPGDDAVAAPVALLGHVRPGVRKGAALALDEFAEVPAWAARAVEALRADPDPDVARAAAFVVGELAGPGRQGPGWGE